MNKGWIRNVRGWIKDEGRRTTEKYVVKVRRMFTQTKFSISPPPDLNIYLSIYLSKKLSKKKQDGKAQNELTKS